MSLELWSTVFSGATFIVIAATAIAALIQLRHMRTGNQLNALLTLMQMWDTPDMQTHIQYSRTALQQKFKDPKFLAQYAKEASHEPSTRKCSSLTIGSRSGRS